jgi:hypothetical protein
MVLVVFGLLLLAGGLFPWPVKAPDLTHVLNLDPGVRIVASERASLRLLPSPSITLAPVVITDARDRVLLASDAIAVELSTLALVRGRMTPDGLSIQSPRVVFDQVKQGHTLQDHPILSSLPGLAAVPVVFRNASVITASGEATGTALSGFEGVIKAAHGGLGLRAKGSFNDKPVRVSLAVGTEQGPAGERDMKASIASDLADVAIDGRVTTRGGFHANGRLSVALTDLAQSAQWLHRTDRLPGVKLSLTLSSLIKASGTSVDLSDVSLQLGGVQASGIATLSRLDGTPTLAATLDVGNIDIPAPAAQAALGIVERVVFPEVAGETSFLPFNLDLRLSARRLAVHDHHFTSPALSVRSRNGSAELVIADMGWNGAQVRARIAASRQGQQQEFRATASADQVPLSERATAPGVGRLSGMASAQLALDANGRTWSAALSSLRGRGTLSIRNGTIHGFDAEALLIEIDRQGPAAPNVGDQRTAFQTAVLPFRVGDGRADIVQGHVQGQAFAADVIGQCLLSERACEGRAVLKSQQTGSDGSALVEAALNWAGSPNAMTVRAQSGDSVKRGNLTRNWLRF